MPPDSLKTPPTRPISVFTSFFALYFWATLKNVIGWMLILASLPVAISIPLPLAFPMFLIGFAMITFPGKRRITSRVLRGRPINVANRQLSWISGALALVLPPLIVWLFARRQHSIIHIRSLGLPGTVALYCLAIAGAWLAIRAGIRGLNLGLHLTPRLRRRVRPWMRRGGVRLLPPRRKRLARTAPHTPPNEQIIEFDQEQVLRARRILQTVPYEGQRAFAWIFKPRWFRRRGNSTREIPPRDGASGRDGANTMVK